MKQSLLLCLALIFCPTSLWAQSNKIDKNDILFARISLSGNELRYLSAEGNWMHTGRTLDVKRYHNRGFFLWDKETQKLSGVTLNGNYRELDVEVSPKDYLFLNNSIVERKTNEVYVINAFGKQKVYDYSKGANVRLAGTYLLDFDYGKVIAFTGFADSREAGHTDGKASIKNIRFIGANYFIQTDNSIMTISIDGRMYRGSVSRDAIPCFDYVIDPAHHQIWRVNSYGFFYPTDETATSCNE